MAINYAATVLAEPNLLHYWKLDEATDVPPVDSIPTGKITGVVTQSPAWTIGRTEETYGAKKLVRALQKYIKFPLLTTISGAWAVECWARLDALPPTTAGMYIWGARASSSQTSELTFDYYNGAAGGATPGFRLNVADAAVTRYSTAAGVRVGQAAVGDWHHIVLTADVNSASLIIDGVETVLAYTAGSGVPILCHSSGGIIIGNYNYTSPDTNWMPDMAIQHFAIYGQRMSQATAAAHYALAGTQQAAAKATPGRVPLVFSSKTLAAAIRSGGAGAARPSSGQVFPRGKV